MSSFTVPLSDQQSVQSYAMLLFLIHLDHQAAL